MECVYCKEQCTKAGKYKKIQRYQCKSCKRYQQESYSKQRIPEEKYSSVRELNNEGCGIRLCTILQVLESRRTKTFTIQKVNK